MSAGCAKVITWPVRMVNDWLTVAAVAYTIPPLVPPVCAATIVHRPDATIDTVPPLVTVQVPLVVEV
jgi:hypothetical protein